MNKPERDRLIETHLELARALAKHVARSLPPSFDLDDLEATGRVALIECADRYRPEEHNGTPFSAYARQRIRGAILDSVRRRHYTENTRPSLDEVTDRGFSCGVETEIDRGREKNRIHAAIGKLPARDRAAIQAKFFDRPGSRAGANAAVLALRELLEAA